MEGRDILHQEKRFMMSNIFTPGCAEQVSVCVGWGNSVGEKGCMCRVTK